MKRTLLIVDDHAGFRSFARALLEADGYEVVVRCGLSNHNIRPSRAADTRRVGH